MATGVWRVAWCCACWVVQVYEVLNEVVIDRGSNSFLTNIEAYIGGRFITRVQVGCYTELHHIVTLHFVCSWATGQQATSAQFLKHIHTQATARLVNTVSRKMYGTCRNPSCRMPSEAEGHLPGSQYSHSRISLTATTLSTHTTARRLHSPVPTLLSWLCRAVLCCGAPFPCRLMASCWPRPLAQQPTASQQAAAWCTPMCKPSC